MTLPSRHTDPKIGNLGVSTTPATRPAGEPLVHHFSRASMSRSAEAPGKRIVEMWRRLAPLPGGRWLFSRILGRMVPYSGGLGAKVLTLEPGRVLVELRERRAVRNHLRSVHAVALITLGELASGLAVLAALPAGVRGIVTELGATYEKKARGRLVAEARYDGPPPSGSEERRVRAMIRDETGDVVCTVTATWLVEPRDP